VLLGVGTAVWALLIEPRRLVIHEAALTLPSWPAEHAGLRVALLSDIHAGAPHWQPDHAREMVALTNAQHPDLVLLAGDYVIDGVRLGTKVDAEVVAEILGGLRAPLGVVAVLGNHDWWNDGERIGRLLSARGIVVLENRTHVIEHHGRRLHIAGLADEMNRQPRPRETLDTVPTGEPVIVVVHEPDVFPDVDARANLTVAGHTHGGQVALPLFGRLVVPSRYGQRYAAGHVIEGGRHLFVTTGIGTSIIPVRFGVPPEIALLTLR